MPDGTPACWFQCANFTRLASVDGMTCPFHSESALFTKVMLVNSLLICLFFLASTTTAVYASCGFIVYIYKYIHTYIRVRVYVYMRALVHSTLL